MFTLELTDLEKACGVTLADVAALRPKGAFIGAFFYLPGDTPPALGRATACAAFGGPAEFSHISSVTGYIGYRASADFSALNAVSKAFPDRVIAHYMGGNVVIGTITLSDLRLIAFDEEYVILWPSFATWAEENRDEGLAEILAELDPEDPASRVDVIIRTITELEK